jgi:hypothetical protein
MIYESGQMALLTVIAKSAERATRQSLYKKARFVFGRDCRVALRSSQQV